MSAFMIFVSKNREKTKLENPGMTFADMAKLLGNTWKNMSDSEKEVFYKYYILLSYSFEYKNIIFSFIFNINIFRSILKKQKKEREGINKN